MSANTRLNIILCLGINIIYSCANIVMPTGGSNDQIPPKIIYTIPTNNQLNFNGKEIEIKFDEFIELESPQNTITISPFTPQEISYRLEGKKLFIRPSQGFIYNTTYIVQLNDAVKDLNEGNKLKNQTLVFSTGNKIDTGTIQLDINLVKTNEYSDLTRVELVKDKQDLLSKDKSKYITTTNLGKALFQNIKNDKYWVYAYTDSNQNKRWDQNEYIAFSNSQISTGQYSKLILFQKEILEKSSPIITKHLEPVFGKNQKEEVEYRNDLVEFKFKNIIKGLNKSKIHITLEKKEIKANFIFNSNNLMIKDLDYDKTYTLRLDSMALYNDNQYNIPLNYTFKTYSKDKTFDNTTIQTKQDTKSKNYLYSIEYQDELKQELPINGIIKISKFFGDKIKIHIVDDLNQNGKWENGNFEKEIQPEPYRIETINLTQTQKTYIIK